MEKKIEIINKVYYPIKTKDKTSVLRKLAIACCIIVIAASLLKGDGLSGVPVGIIALLFVNLSGSMSRKKVTDAYKTVFADLILDNEKMQLWNKDVDKEDGFGLRDETYTFLWDKVSAIYFSSELMGICVEGDGVLTMKWTSDQRKEKADKTIEVKHAYIYFKDEQQEEVMQAIESVSGKRIQITA